jgi:starch phosphorylase
LQLGVRLNGLAPGDVVVEAVMSRAIGEPGDGKRSYRFVAAAGAQNDDGEWPFKLDLSPEFCGHLDYVIRAYPYHEALAHPFEMGRMIWA